MDNCGFRIDGVWIHNPKEKLSYLLQHPDPHYKSTFIETVDTWTRNTPDGLERLCLFESVDLTKPCPEWMSLWVIQMLRLEKHLPRDVVGDPSSEHDPVQAGGSSLLMPRTRAATAEVSLIGGSAEEDDEAVSDAESILDSVNVLNLPNSATWDWATMSSRHRATMEMVSAYFF
jgi:hypothetical protein